MGLLAASRWTKPIILWFSALLVGMWISTQPTLALCYFQGCTYPSEGTCPNVCNLTRDGDYYLDSDCFSFYCYAGICWYWTSAEPYGSCEFICNNSDFAECSY